MDVEGADWNALRGGERLLRSDPPPHLILEVNDSAARALGFGAMEMVDWVMSLGKGYDMVWLDRKGMRAIDRYGLQKLVDRPRGFFNVWFNPR
jgi:hypothetical protein